MPISVQCVDLFLKTRFVCRDSPIMIQVIRLVYVGVVKQRDKLLMECAGKLPESRDYGRTYKSFLAIDH